MAADDQKNDAKPEAPVQTQDQAKDQVKSEDQKSPAVKPSPRKPVVAMSDEPFEAPKPKLSARTLAEMKRGKEAINR